MSVEGDLFRVTEKGSSERHSQDDECGTEDFGPSVSGPFLRLKFKQFLSHA